MVIYWRNAQRRYTVIPYHGIGFIAFWGNGQFTEAPAGPTKKLLPLTGMG